MSATDSKELQQLLRQLPKVDRLLAHREIVRWGDHPAITGTVREVLDQVRRELLAGKTASPPDLDAVARRVSQALTDRYDYHRLVRVINATGILVHTNLGRSPLAEEAIEAMNHVARGYSTLEYDRHAGRRGSRHDLVRGLLSALTGAEDALVANNNAAALLLALTAVSEGRAVIVSRGQLVEIGGSFRIPDICRVSGAPLREVGTTNRTHLKDYRAAIDENAGLLLRVHPSNFRVDGFTRSVSLKELVALGEETGLPVVDDLGSGALADVSKVAPLPREPLVAESVAAGASVVTFSGDKLLGGPQAGIAVGRRDVIARMRSHPLMRAVRPDKLTFAALDATLRLYLNDERRMRDLPLWRMLGAELRELDEWGMELLERIEGVLAEAGLQGALVASRAYAGGGSLPEEELPSRAVAITGPQSSLNSLQTRLRMGELPLIGYLREGQLLLDVRSMLIEDVDTVVRCLERALEEGM